MQEQNFRLTFLVIKFDTFFSCAVSVCTETDTLLPQIYMEVINYSLKFPNYPNLGQRILAIKDSLLTLPFQLTH